MCPSGLKSAIFLPGLISGAVLITTSRRSPKSLHLLSPCAHFEEVLVSSDYLFKSVNKKVYTKTHKYTLTNTHVHTPCPFQVFIVSRGLT